MQFTPVRSAIILFVALFGFLFAIPNFLSKEQFAAWPDFLPKQTMVLGLDLQGGSHLLLGVNRDSIISERLKTLRRDVRAKLANEAGIGNLITTEANGVVVELTDPTQHDAAMTALKTLQNNISASLLTVGGVPELEFADRPDGKIAVSLTSAGVTERLSSIVAQSMEVIRNRIDQVGTTEPTIQRQGQDRIMVQVPGFEDSTRLKELISRTARLTFHLVHPSMGPQQAEAAGIPAGYMILPSDDGGTELLNENIELGGESLT
ncbi:MAG: protein translocase subunit SecDF, partial [Massilia sp.]